MFIELIDSLRCTNDHADSWLVASIARREDRFVLAGMLGCPVCRREYPIADGIAWFGRTAETRAEHRAAPSAVERGDVADPIAREEAMRIGAFLSLSEGATIVLCGEWARRADAVAELMPLRIFAVNPLPPEAVPQSEAVGIVQSDEGLPFAPGIARGVALDATTATDVNVASAVRVLADGGRLVAPVDTAVPSAVTVLARDESFWVGEKHGSFVPLRRR